MFSVSYDKLNIKGECESQHQVENQNLGGKILHVIQNIKVKLLNPSRVSGVYFYHGEED
jgi:hypothetical protein